jgi:uncharacterized Fe-S center protein
MKEPVYFLKVSQNEDDHQIADRLKKLLTEKDLLKFVDERDMVAIKTHFGEDEEVGYVRPPVLRVIGDLVRERMGSPFLTETSTLYTGDRNNAAKHIALAHKHGFGFDNTNMPIIMADGLFGDEETEVEIPGRLNHSVKIASLIVRTQAVIMVSHFTGHIVAGFGAALKNLGMGCASRKGKLVQHSTMKPKIKTSECTICEICMEYCPSEAITMTRDSALIDGDIFRKTSSSTRGALLRPTTVK